MIRIHITHTHKHRNKTVCLDNKRNENEIKLHWVTSQSGLMQIFITFWYFLEIVRRHNSHIFMSNESNGLEPGNFQTWTKVTQKISMQEKWKYFGIKALEGQQMTFFKRNRLHKWNGMELNGMDPNRSKWGWKKGSEFRNKLYFDKRQKVFHRLLRLLFLFLFHGNWNWPKQLEVLKVLTHYRITQCKKKRNYFYYYLA